MTLALQLVTYNSSAYVPFLFATLVGQTDRDWTLFVLDNSTGEERVKTRALVDQYQDKLPIRYEEASENCGFAGGHQRLFTRHDADLVQLVNPDVLLDPEYVERMRAVLAQYEEVGSAQGLVRRWEWQDGEPVRQDQVDTLGLEVRLTGQVVDVNAGNQDMVAPEGLTSVFGVSGCLPMYRRQAVEESSLDGQLFDPSYVVYKEDVDLAFRLDAGGWSSVIVPWAHAYHKRTFRPSWSLGRASRFTQYYSYRNHLWNLISHVSTRELLLRSWAVVPYELAKLAYMLLRDPLLVRDMIRDTAAYWPVLTQRRAFYAN